MVSIRLYQGIDLFPNGIRSALSLIFGEHSGVALNHLWFILTLSSIYFLLPFVKREFEVYSSKGLFHSYIEIFTILLFIFYFGPVAGNTFFKIPVFPQGIIPNLTSISNKMPFVGLVGPMLFYFLLGGILHLNIEKTQKIPFWVPCLCLSIGAVALYGRWLLESSLSQSTWDSVYSAYVSLPCLLMSISLFVLISKLPFSEISTNTKKFITVLGSNTLGVYYLHWIFGSTFLYQIANVIPFRGIIVNFIKGFCTVVFFSYLSHYAKKIPIVNKLFI